MAEGDAGLPESGGIDPAVASAARVATAVSLDRDGTAVVAANVTSRTTDHTVVRLSGATGHRMSTRQWTRQYSATNEPFCPGAGDNAR